jgi:hypothetical protein
VCAFGDNCPIHDIFFDAQAQLVRNLKAATFDKLLEMEKAKAKAKAKAEA